MYREIDRERYAYWSGYADGLAAERPSRRRRIADQPRWRRIIFAIRVWWNWRGIRGWG